MKKNNKSENREEEDIEKMTLYRENDATFSEFQFTDLSHQTLFLAGQTLVIHDDLSIVVLNPVEPVTAVVIVLRKLTLKEILFDLQHVDLMLHTS